MLLYKRVDRPGNKSAHIVEDCGASSALDDLVADMDSKVIVDLFYQYYNGHIATLKDLLLIADKDRPSGQLDRLHRALYHVTVRVKKSQSTSIWALRNVCVQGPRTSTGGRERIVAILSRAHLLDLGTTCCLVRYALDGHSDAIVSWEPGKSFSVKHVAEPIRQLMRELGHEYL
jgi:hypothetical protein